ncbi:MAG TPA: patatin-like phospholipase family protein [Pseudomonas sabulinigri]|uniref:PNPLA domain-containing protein n=1 Tax=marine sediment metagenome TaxID=412755 RepID=A0A0F9V650_9ZZZZ|nr:patatin-like phospholipase family protein [Halopseudomonas sabulinigri]HEC53432.1 patatin-like phospholipase family protein [Halopseudomonas sabulinigri]
MPAIHVSAPALTLRAGHRAIEHIRKNGLQPADVHMIPGAAGGPKALGIQGLDLALFGEWLPRAPQMRSLIGASIGSWRFASACMPDPVAALRQLGELYTNMRFPKGVSIQRISAACGEMLDELLGGEFDSILSNPNYHLNIVVVKSLGLLQHDSRTRLGLGLSGVIGANLLGRRHLGRFFERVILHDPRQRPPLDDLQDFKSSHVNLTPDNLRAALLASGSIPMVMEAVREIPGTAAGVYRDGGLLDYHLDLPYQAPGVVLYPHFLDRVVPGWFDKTLPWRKANPQQLRDVLLLAPSREYLDSLPYRKLPDRKDFNRFVYDNDGREKYWRTAMSESQRLGDAFLQLVESEDLISHVQPL